MQKQPDEQIFTMLIQKFSCVLENIEKSEIYSLKQSLEECLDYVKEMGAACEIEDLQNIKVQFIDKTFSFCIFIKYQLSKTLLFTGIRNVSCRHSWAFAAVWKEFNFKLTVR